MFQFCQIQHQVVGPHGGAFTDGGGLSGLEVGQAQARQIAVTGGKGGQPINDRHQPDTNDIDRFAQQNQIGVVRDETTGGSPVDDRPRRGADIAVSVHVGHYVVAETAFILPRGIEVDVLRLALQLGNLLVGNRQAQFLLGLSQRDPQESPGAKFALIAPQTAHLVRSVPADQGVLIQFVRHGERRDPGSMTSGSLPRDRVGAVARPAVAKLTF